MSEGHANIGVVFRFPLRRGPEPGSARPTQRPAALRGAWPTVLADNMKQTTFEDVLTRIMKVAELYHRLVLVVGPVSSGKTRALQRLADDLGGQVINVNLEASKRLLELSETGHFLAR